MKIVVLGTGNVVVLNGMGFGAIRGSVLEGADVQVVIEELLNFIVVGVGIEVFSWRSVHVHILVVVRALE